MGGAAHGFAIEQARIEQAACLDHEIEENKRLMKDAARKVRCSIDWWVGLVFVAAIILVGILLVREVVQVPSKTSVGMPPWLINGT